MFKKKNHIAKQAEEVAIRTLSSFEGRESNFEGSYEGDESYVGLGDDALQFTNAQSFLSVGNASDLTFSFRLQNATSAKKVIALFPTYLGTAAALATASGQTVDYILTDGTIATNITGTAGDSMVTIANLQNFTLKHPSQIVEITLAANTSLAFNEVVICKELSPYRQLPGNKIPLTKYVLPDQYNNSKAVLPIWRDFPWLAGNDQLAILVPIGGTETVATTGVILDFTITFGAIRNVAAELNNKVKRASQNIQRMQMKGVLQK
jgi:hypothetical protein